MGLSAFNAMRARMKAEQEALAKANAEKASVVPTEEIKPAEIENSVEPAEVVEEVPQEEVPENEPETDEKVEEVVDEPPKKTDAEKLKKKKV